jgi:hypothetical protein
MLQTSVGINRLKQHQQQLDKQNRQAAVDPLLCQENHPPALQQYHAGITLHLRTSYLLSLKCCFAST